MAESFAKRNSSEIFILVIFSLIGGVIGGVAWEKMTDFQESKRVVEETETVAPEDMPLTTLVSENSIGVVSIVVKKSLTEVQGNFPFFFLQPSIPEETPSSESELQQVGAGSGFFVTTDGIIVTNKHVIEDESATYSVFRPGDEQEYAVTVIAKDPVNDIAFLKVEGGNFPALTLGNSDTTKVGETAIAIGNSLGEFANSVSRGIISGKQRSVTAGTRYGEIETLSGILQTDAAINPGNSGGPLFNLQGEVIGMNVAVAQGAENIGFAIPINQVKIRLEQVKKTGKIEVPFIGVRYVVVNEMLKKELNLPENYGAVVLRGRTVTDFAVVPNSPAEKAGIKEGDVLLTIDGKKITSESVITEVLSAHQVGDDIPVMIWRGGEIQQISLTLEERT